MFKSIILYNYSMRLLTGQALNELQDKPKLFKSNTSN
jgi:hypothetical protein